MARDPTLVDVRLSLAKQDRSKRVARHLGLPYRTWLQSIITRELDRWSDERLEQEQEIERNSRTA